MRVPAQASSRINCMISQNSNPSASNLIPSTPSPPVTMATAHSDVSEFFRTCSIRDLQWLAGATAVYFTGLGTSTVDASLITPTGFIINREERTVPFPSAGSGKDSAIDALTAFVDCLLDSASWDNNVLVAKQSRIRCRNTSLIALDLIYSKLTELKAPEQWVSTAKKHQSSILSGRSKRHSRASS